MTLSLWGVGFGVRQTEVQIMSLPSYVLNILNKILKVLKLQFPNTR